MLMAARRHCNIEWVIMKDVVLVSEQWTFVPLLVVVCWFVSQFWHAFHWLGFIFAGALTRSPVVNDTDVMGTDDLWQPLLDNEVAWRLLLLLIVTLVKDVSPLRVFLRRWTRQLNWRCYGFQVGSWLIRQKVVHIGVHRYPLTRSATWWWWPRYSPVLLLWGELVQYLLCWVEGSLPLPHFARSSLVGHRRRWPSHWTRLYVGGLSLNFLRTGLLRAEMLQLLIL